MTFVAFTRTVTCLLLLIILSVSLGSCTASTPSPTPPPNESPSTENVSVRIQYAPPSANSSGVQSLTLYVRLFDTSLSASKYDLECGLHVDGSGGFICDRLDVPVNLGGTDHRVWVGDPSHPQLGLTSPGIVASGISVNGQRVRIFPNPLQEFGFFQVDATGQVR
jgi:hypothetical protein